MLSRPRTAPNRLVALQRLCQSELSNRGVESALEVPLRGAYMRRGWDVASLRRDGRPRIAISCKSILCDHTGAAPNRVDELLGEASNLHGRFPTAALGYFVLVSRVDRAAAATARRSDPSIAARERARNDKWFEAFGQQLAHAGGRSDPARAPQRWEAVCALQFDVSDKDDLTFRAHPDLQTFQQFIDRLSSVANARDLTTRPHPGLLGQPLQRAPT